MKSKKILTATLAVIALTSSSCKKNDNNVSSSSSPAKKVTLNISAYYEKDDTHMKFVESNSPYEGVDGKTYNSGDFKPVWSQIQKDLDFTINDVSPSGGITIKNNFTTLSASKFEQNGTTVNVAQGNSDQIIAEGTNNGTLVDLSQYLDKMPDFKKFLEENSSVKKTISNKDGAIYYAPYFDGYDDIERMMMVRQDWVEKLLDGEQLPDNLDREYAVPNTINHYTPFYSNDINTTIDVLNEDGTGKKTITKNIKASENIILQMNNEKLQNGLDSVQKLREYIDKHYSSFGNKRSKLFIGGEACYDVDEFVALLRCVKLNPHFLTGRSDVTIVPFFPRAQSSDRTWDYYRFLQFFGLRGVESRQQWFFVDKDGKINDVRGTTEFANALEKLHQMYEDGLLLENFTTTKIDDSTDYRGSLYGKSNASATMLGFATYDYNQTTTALMSKNSDLHVASILPAVADFDDGVDGNFIHYTESWRSVKTQGWFITKATTGAELDKALELFNYLYSDKGNTLMSYGPDAYLDHNSDGTLKTMDYQGKQVPVLNSETLKELNQLENGNYTNYYRKRLGGTFPVGYIKQQGMEYQTVVADAQKSLNMINKAIEHDVLQHPNHNSNNANHLNDIVPTTLPFTKAQNDTIATFTDLNKVFTSDKKQVMVISDIVMKGWNGHATYKFTDATDFTQKVKASYKLDQYVAEANTAYDIFKNL